MLKYQYEIDHTHVYGWVRVVNDMQSLRAHGVKIEKEDEHLLDREATHYIIYGSRLSRWLVRLFPSTKTRKKVRA